MLCEAVEEEDIDAFLGIVERFMIPQANRPSCFSHFAPSYDLYGYHHNCGIWFGITEMSLARCMVG